MFFFFFGCSLLFPLNVCIYFCQLSTAFPMWQSVEIALLISDEDAKSFSVYLDSLPVPWLPFFFFF